MPDRGPKPNIVRESTGHSCVTPRKEAAPPLRFSTSAPRIGMPGVAAEADGVTVALEKARG